jgi:hypothetical protein
MTIPQVLAGVVAALLLAIASVYLVKQATLPEAEELIPVFHTGYGECTVFRSTASNVLVCVCYSQRTCIAATPYNTL